MMMSITIITALRANMVQLVGAQIQHLAFSTLEHHKLKSNGQMDWKIINEMENCRKENAVCKKHNDQACD